ncbi:glycosyltransferase family 2 protein [uncultured Rikenella sp.]|uniref:glycosyltransferase family 2 protein n=1 Tax=uncultured Rikenella sp. TaxID=368003 RepID=UPI002621A0D7|nr:glycosyltransferase family 2 protein [uncultured Rikenella sp.]
MSSTNFPPPPAISVVMPAFNAGEYIQESVECVLKQTLENIELVIVDDCSTDNTWEIISKIAASDPRCVVYRLEKNSGSAKYPRDLAVSRSRASLICWVDSDDKIAPDYLEQLLRKQETADADVVCSRMVAFDEETPCRYTLPRRGFDYDRIMPGKEAVMLTIGVSWSLNVNGFLVRKSLWEHTAHYLNREVVQMNADDFASREMLLHAGKVAFCPVAYYYRLHQQSITKAISHKLFEPLITDQMVIRMFERHYPAGSDQLSRAWNQYFGHWILMMRNFVVKNDRFSADSRVRARALLKEHKRQFGFRRISKDRMLTLKEKMLLLLPFGISTRIIKIINT